MTQATPRSSRRRGRAPLLWGTVAAGVVLAAWFAMFAPAQSSPVGDRSMAPASATVWYDYEVVNVYPHDPEAFTQGLVFRDGYLYESTGLAGRSSLRKVRIETGEVLQRSDLDARYFGEGLAEASDTLVQLTWTSNVGFVYDLRTFEVIRRFNYAGEGWGLVRDNGRFVMSDGSATLRFLDVETLEETGRLAVTEQGRPVTSLNELEMVRGEIYANIWQSDEIVMIAPADGRVVGRVDLRGLLSREDRARPVDVLNGIAYDAEGDRLFVTGKLWPRLFEIRLRRRG